MLISHFSAVLPLAVGTFALPEPKLPGLLGGFKLGLPQPPSVGGLIDAWKMPIPLAMKPSPDGTCGSNTGYTCLGSSFGECCSADGKCGSDEQHCFGGCLPFCGLCKSKPQPPPPSTDGKCGDNGRTCVGSSFGDCCSAQGWCGSDSSYCDTGCKLAYGLCKPPPAVSSNLYISAPPAAASSAPVPWNSVEYPSAALASCFASVSALSSQLVASNSLVASSALLAESSAYDYVESSATPPAQVSSKVEYYTSLLPSEVQPSSAEMVYSSAAESYPAESSPAAPESSPAAPETSPTPAPSSIELVISSAPPAAESSPAASLSSEYPIPSSVEVYPSSVPLAPSSIEVPAPSSVQPLASPSASAGCVHNSCTPFGFRQFCGQVCSGTPFWGGCPSLQACGDACKGQSGCTSYTWSRDDQNCYLGNDSSKFGFGSLSPFSSYDSAVQDPTCGGSSGGSGSGW